MSSKSSIAYEHGEGFYRHIYHCCFDNEPVQPIHIEQSTTTGSRIENIDLSLSPKESFQIWRAVDRQVSHLRLCAGETDEEIETRCRDAVEKAVGHYEEWVRQGQPNGTALALLSFHGEGDPASLMKDRIDEARSYRDQCRLQLAALEPSTEGAPDASK